MSEQIDTIVTEPVRPRARPGVTWLVVLATLVVIGVCILFFDTRIAQAMPRWVDHHPTVATLERIAFHMGDWTLAPVLLGVVLVIAGRRWLCFLSAFVLAYLVRTGGVELLKWGTGRPRPRQMDGLTVFYGPSAKYHAFPSGHAAFAFMFATMLSAWWPRWRVLWYGLATYVSLSRMISDAHFLSDIIMGGLIGVLSALLILRRWPPPTREEEPADAGHAATDSMPQ